MTKILPSVRVNFLARFASKPLLYHWGQNYYIPYLWFWGIIFGNYYRKLYRIIFLGGINKCNVRIGADLPWKPRKFVYNYSFSLGAVGELITVM